ncbi:ribosomal protein S18 acetylase RimI-like enzyme [Enterococcus sp. PF1-24]|uniref:GNAT family N-acetyltransferase n=1 Tax=unclassified Enterococcus TaxID=2608891 RepID=UPI002474C366|nr:MULTISPECIES: GNAT family N-acetyltransferase [unclassified Enterococcus]MDH6365763.1 ribosomal protein S18 acetylase RimI-like enzyme [Enterococcus sp. PFB1-1]MDH6402854.1 ribosomal protein S18 acetylase RimI-like enzyme [Enterococcus sp. PF1-24]
MTVEIKDLTVADLPQLWQIEQAIWTNDNAPNLNEQLTFADYQENTLKQTILVAKEGDQVLGFINYHHPSKMAAHSKQWILGIGVAAEAQGKGIGAKLITALIEKAKQEGIKKISLRVMETNPRAKAFYLRRGFQEEGFLKNEFWLDNHFVGDYYLAYYLD